jgi:hypothetical protein
MIQRSLRRADSVANNPGAVTAGMPDIVAG